MILPTKTGEFDLTDDLIAALHLKYPMVAVRNECLKMMLWLTENPARRPKMPLRFVKRWLGRIQPPKLAHSLSGPLSNAQIDAMGVRLGIPARAGEGYQAWERRLRQAEQEQDRQKARENLREMMQGPTLR